MHILSWFAFFGETPLGQLPTVEEQIYLEEAQGLNHDTISEKAPPTLYGYVLRLAGRFASDTEGFLITGRLVNGIAMMLATLFSAFAASQLWRAQYANIAAGALIGLNPVVVFWAADISPILCATACVALAAWRAIKWLRNCEPVDSALISTALVTGVAFEPALIFVFFAWLFLAILYPRRRRGIHIMAAIVPSLIGLGIGLFLKLGFTFPDEIAFETIPKNLYILFNNYEFHEGKSFALQEGRSRLLSFNPIHWGLVLVVSIIGIFVHLKEGHRARNSLIFIGAFGLFALGYLIFDGDSRTRICILPILAIPAAGIINLPRTWREVNKRTKRKLVAGVLAIGVLAYPAFFEIKTRVQYLEEFSHMARAHLATGDIKRARTWAGRALYLDINLPELNYIIIRAAFDEWALGGHPQPLSVEVVQSKLEAHSRSTEYDPKSKVIEGIYLWKLQENEKAIDIWETHQNDIALARLCLFWIEEADKPDDLELARFKEKADYALLRDATLVDRNMIGYQSIEKTIDNMLAPAF